MLTVTNVLLVSSASVIVRSGGLVCLKHVAMVLLLRGYVCDVVCDVRE